MYFEILERYSNLIYPAIAVLAVTLVIAGILQAWQTHDLDGLARMELKRDIILELRRQVGGVPADVLARALTFERLTVMKLLEEMQRDGIVVSHTNTSHLTLWRVKGVGGAALEPVFAPRPPVSRLAAPHRAPRLGKQAPTAGARHQRARRAPGLKHP